MDVVNTVNEQTARGVGLLHKAFQILELFSADQPSWTQAEIGRATDLTRSTVSRLVRYLCGRGYLAYQERTGRYTLGYGAIELGRRAQLQFDLASMAVDLLEDIGRNTLETVILTGFNPTALHVVCLSQIASQQGGLRVYQDVGATYPLYVGASAKPVLAHLPTQMAEVVLKGPMTPINPAWVQTEDRLRADLKTIREKGYAVSSEETYPGVAGIGAAILDPNGYPIGCIAIAVPMQRVSADMIARYGKMVVEATAAMSERLRGALDRQSGKQAEQADIG